MRRIEDKWQTKLEQEQASVAASQTTLALSFRSEGRKQNATFNSGEKHFPSQFSRVQNKLNQNVIKYQVQNVTYINLVKTKF